MHQRYLAVYDYGTGAVWRYILANSENEIIEKFPKLKLVKEIPEWWSEEIDKKVREVSINCGDDEFLNSMMGKD